MQTILSFTYKPDGAQNVFGKGTVIMKALYNFTPGMNVVM